MYVKPNPPRKMLAVGEQHGIEAKLLSPAEVESFSESVHDDHDF